MEQEREGQKTRHFSEYFRELLSQLFDENKNDELTNKNLSVATKELYRNISTVLRDLGLPYLLAFEANDKCSKEFVDELEQFFTNHSSTLGALHSYLDRAPQLDVKEPLLTQLKELPARKEKAFRLHTIDFAERDKQNKRLGENGEKFVLAFEKERLTAAGRPDLAKRIIWTSKIVGDGAGFDIQSFETDGSTRFIEVKTTNGGIFLPFYFSQNELAFSEINNGNYYLYRVFEYATEAKLFIAQGSLSKISNYYVPVSYKAVIDQQSSADQEIEEMNEKQSSFSNLQKRAVYSVLAVCKASELTSVDVDVIESGLRSGIKHILFFDVAAPLLLNNEKLTNFRKNNFLQLYYMDNPNSVSMGFSVVDGRLTEEDEKKLSSATSKFNVEQFVVEHADPYIHVAVRAGAGTGKTTVMVQRIMYLLQTGAAELDDIAMITFTRDASQVMLRKLREECYKRFHMTQNVRYLNYIEQLPFLRVKTIHSFAKTILQELGSVLGYGSTVQIRSFTMERRRIIEAYLNKSLEKWLTKKTFASKFKSIRLYELVGIIEKYWDEIEKKGYTLNDIKDIVWGGAEDDNKAFHEVFEEVFTKCEKLFQEEKQRSNAVSISDITRQIDLISKQGASFQNISRTIKYLFIDEFQDTDDAQIRLAAAIQNAYQAKLFAVGDIKQSIYRFRGATDTAFEQLNKVLKKQGEKLNFYPLKKNYRTSAAILEELDLSFSAWGEKKWLSYDDDDRLVGMQKLDHSFKAVVVKERKDSSKIKDLTVKMIRNARDSLKQDKEGHTHRIAVLVRTNAQARMLKEWCEPEGIYTELKIGGTFFRSAAVKDFIYLVEALLFSNQPKARVNVLQTPYSAIEMSWPLLASFHGNMNSIMEVLNQSNHLPHPKWQQFRENLRTEPLLSVLRKVIIETDVLNGYYSQTIAALKSNDNNKDIEDEARLRTLQYEKNLNHLLELIHQHFNSDFVTLYSLHEWLLINQATNIEEDEPELEIEDEEESSSKSASNRIQIVTVHKSKGLEYHTVIIPCTERPYRFTSHELLVQRLDNGPIHASWAIASGRDVIYKSNEYFDMSKNEVEEVNKEEARLLYVALTRCEQRLWIIKNNHPMYAKENSNWAKILPYKELREHGCLQT